MYVSKKKSTDSMTFGYQRAEILGALASVVTIWVLGSILTYEAVIRLIKDVKKDGDAIDSVIMTIIGTAGLVVNIIDALILAWGNASHGHSHGGGHSHGHGGATPPAAHTHNSGNGNEPAGVGDHGHSHSSNVNVRAAFIHAIGDCAQSVGVMAAAGTIWAGNHFTYGTPTKHGSLYNIADPAASLLFGIVTLFTTFSITRGIFKILMHSTPESVDMEQLRRDIRAIPHVIGMHHLHVWSLTFDHTFLSAHIIAPSEFHAQVLSQAESVCNAQNIKHTTIQMDCPEGGCAIEAESSTHQCS